MKKASAFIKKYWHYILIALSLLIAAIMYFSVNFRNAVLSALSKIPGLNKLFQSDQFTNSTAGNALKQPNISEESRKAGYNALTNIYSKEYSDNIQRLFQHETGNYTSGGWKATANAGMAANSNTFPYGWPALQEFVTERSAADIKTWVTNKTDNGSGKKQIAFDSAFHSIYFVGWFIKEKRDGNIAAWNSLDPTAQAEYLALVNKQTPLYT